VAVSANNANGKYFAVIESGKLKTVIFAFSGPKIHVSGHGRETVREMENVGKTVFRNVSIKKTELFE
jgi:hypothetical protein